MEKANYVFKGIENIRVPKNDGSHTRKKVVLIISGVLIFGSFLLGDNLLGELSWIAKVLFIGLFFGSIFKETEEFKPYPIELHFYADGVEIRRLDVYYNKRLRRQENFYFRYNDIKSCVFSQKNKMLTITGFLHVKYFNYEENGELSASASRDKTGEGFCMFYTHADPSVDFVKVIEENSPVKVTVE